MNISNLNDYSKAVATKIAFQGEEGKVIALQILKGEQLKEHLTKTPAFLICIKGNATYENEKGIKVELLIGDFVLIEANVKHWVNAQIDTDLLLIK